MKKFQFKNKNNKSAGITLIALVITIIVLLILAGISIAMLSGDNSILSRATDAKEKSGIAQAEERIKMSYNAALTEDLAEGKGNIQKSTLETELAKEFPGSTISVEEDSNDSTKWVVTVDGVSLTVQAGISTAALEEDENTVEALAKAGTIKRWDKIDYNPGTKTTASIELPEGASIEGTKVAAISLPAGATLGGTISASSATDWVVLDVNQSTGEVLIMPQTVSNTTLTLSGKDGYNNALTALQAVADIYLNPAQGASVRSLTVDDVNKVEGHTPNGTVAEYTWNHRYGMDSNLNITDTGSDSDTPNQTYTSTTTSGSYSYNLSALNRIPSCWLASRCVTVLSSSGSFCVRSLNTYGDGVNAINMLMVHSYRSTETFSDSFTVCPIVTLKSDIQIENTGSYTEVATGTATATATGALAERLGEHNVWTIK